MTIKRYHMGKKPIDKEVYGEKDEKKPEYITIPCTGEPNEYQVQNKPIKLVVKDSDYSKCEEEIKKISEDVSAAMDIVAEVKKRFPDDGDRKELLDILEKCIHKKLDMGKENANSLIRKYGIKEKTDKNELLYIIKQLEKRLY